MISDFQIWQALIPKFQISSRNTIPKFQISWISHSKISNFIEKHNSRIATTLTRMKPYMNCPESVLLAFTAMGLKCCHNFHFTISVPIPDFQISFSAIPKFHICFVIPKFQTQFLIPKFQKIPFQIFKFVFPIPKFQILE